MASSMGCARCAGNNPPGAKFCRLCGAALGAVCPSCGHASDADSRFCNECGVALVPDHRAPASYTPRHLAERILAARHGIEGEIKQVTVLFCDLCDSTGLAERLGPENMHELLNRFFARALAAIHRYEGTINQFLGDGFMALFGAPIALEDHVRRAMFAAVDIRRETTEAPVWPGEVVDVRIGLNTGPVVVGKIGDDLRADYTAVGDVTNVAARLQQGAAPGEIIVSDAIRRLADEFARLEPLGPLPVRGKSVPVEACRLLGLGPRRRAPGDRAARTLTPFVGREMEMRALAELLEAAERGQGMAVGVVGEPGIGKSRLMLEFRRSLESGRVTCLESQGL